MRTELGLNIRVAPPEAKPEDVAWLVGKLRAEGKSLSAGQLAVMKFGNDSETSKRKIRRIASSARPRVVSSPGSDGYDLWARMKQDDILHNIESMMASGRAQVAEGLDLLKAYHARYRGEPGDAVTQEELLTR